MPDFLTLSIKFDENCAEPKIIVATDKIKKMNERINKKKE